MNILNKLTLKHLKMNKKRTLVTIIGITLSTALMTGIGLLVSSLLVTERTAAINTFGSYHTKFENLNEDMVSTISKNINVLKSYYYEPLGYALVDSKKLSKPYLYIVNGNSEFLNTLKLVEGTLPTNESEIVISEHANMTGGLNYQVGDIITLDIGARVVEEEEVSITKNSPLRGSWDQDDFNYIVDELQIKTTKTYKVVGIVEESVYEDYNSAGFMVFSYTNEIQSLATLYVEYKHPNKTYDYIQEFTNHLALDSSSVSANQNLLYYYGATSYDNINKTMLPLMIIALSVISIGCIIVIYNSFAISTMERKKSFGLYASIGTTMKQIKKTVLFEAIIVGVIGIALGILGAFLGIYIVIDILNYLLKDSFASEMIFSVNLIYLLVPLLFMVAVILISAYLPAKRASKVSPIEAIRGNNDIKISKKEVKAPKWIRKIFGIEGDLAYKNIKRNKKKYRVTIISLFISIIMFNTFTTFLGYIVKATDSFDYTDYDIGLTFYDSDLNTIKNDIEQIKNKYSITHDITILYQLSYQVTNLNRENFSLAYQNAYLQDENMEYIPFNLIVLSNEDYQSITNEKAILLSNAYYIDYSNGNRFTSDITLFNKEKYTLKGTINNNEVLLDARVYQNSILGLKQLLYESSPNLIISLDTFHDLNLNQKEEFSFYFINTKEYQKLYDDLENGNMKLNSKYYLSSPTMNAKQTKNIVLAIKILFYGFITLVTLIGVTSVINTINTSMNLRRKEFAMLRSVGLTPKGFNKILFFESLFFGLKSLLYGIPVSIGINYLILKSFSNMIKMNMIIPWKTLFISILGVFMIVMITMNYASKKMKKENILEALREENI